MLYKTLKNTSRDQGRIELKSLQNLRYQVRGSKPHNKRRGELSPDRGLQAVPGTLRVFFNAKFYDSGDLEVDSLEVEGSGYVNTSGLPVFVTIYQYIPTLLLLSIILY